MKKELKLFRCKHCGNIVEMVESSGVSIVCCNEQMKELVANTTDGAKEKHVPVIKVNDTIVTIEVGTIAHPMLEEHHISWIILETEEGFQKKYLDPTGAPVASFAITPTDKVIAAYEYCNLHGLWKATL